MGSTVKGPILVLLAGSHGDELRRAEHLVLLRSLAQELEGVGGPPDRDVEALEEVRDRA